MAGLAHLHRDQALMQAVNLGRAIEPAQLPQRRLAAHP
jgi:hypothetical protein